MPCTPPLVGLKVLELGGLAPSPFAGLILADYGADVVRVDRTFEVFGPPRDTLCRRKRSVVIDFKDAPSRRVFLDLVKVADVLIDPYRPGVMTRLGLGPETLCQLNPRLIYAHLHGFRPEGVYGIRAGHDINYLAAAGILSLLGRKDENPAPPANILGDFAGGGLVCVTGILFALLHRQATGRGQVVTTNMVDGSAYLATFMRQQQGHPNNDRPRGENLLDGAAPFYEVYKTKDDRFVAVGAQEPQFYKSLLQGMGLDEKEMPEQWDRTQWPKTKELFTGIFKQKTMEEWRAVFDHTDGCVTPVLNMDETERPFKPLVDLSASPSLDVSVQESYPELKKGAGGEDVLQEWIPESRSGIDIDPSSKLLRMKHAAKL
ncbi:alpha-methylacyl-CoA racemase [Cladophialophora yegresii CBS 114405]|uniref:Alpha-methylacyl-CoA racemase n=1 Tax=Cladophialophora yegresii CBS 114405 TaxID=1182544 RepID=W9W6P4_9EURO|nr:alpha-methylacyl-CoA racemase [Cladophialophora yegresii CBS 114405]EXJ63762.1 alpha-methylacyl-CoA racemase [Cladophialophora yegresii CBS 114405]